MWANLLFATREVRDVLLDVVLLCRPIKKLPHSLGERYRAVTQAPGDRTPRKRGVCHIWMVCTVSEASRADSNGTGSAASTRPRCRSCSRSSSMSRKSRLFVSSCCSSAGRDCPQPRIKRQHHSSEKVIDSFMECAAQVAALPIRARVTWSIGLVVCALVSVAFMSHALS